MSPTLRRVVAVRSGRRERRRWCCEPSCVRLLRVERFGERCAQRSVSVPGCDSAGRWRGGLARAATPSAEVLRRWHRTQIAARLLSSSVPCWLAGVMWSTSGACAPHM